MKNTCLLSQDAKTYLCCFYQTLDGMIQGMTAAVLTQSISHNFAVQMLPHCRAATARSRGTSWGDTSYFKAVSAMRAAPWQRGSIWRRNTEASRLLSGEEPILAYISR